MEESKRWPAARPPPDLLGVLPYDFMKEALGVRGALLMLWLLRAQARLGGGDVAPIAGTRPQEAIPRRLRASQVNPDNRGSEARKRRSAEASGNQRENREIEFSSPQDAIGPGPAPG